jgi:hypothetical protein
VKWDEKKRGKRARGGEREWEREDEGKRWEEGREELVTNL